MFQTPQKQTSKIRISETSMLAEKRYQNIHRLGQPNLPEETGRAVLDLADRAKT